MYNYSLLKKNLLIIIFREEIEGKIERLWK